MDITNLCTYLSRVQPVVSAKILFQVSQTLLACTNHYIICIIQCQALKDSIKVERWMRMHTVSTQPVFMPNPN